MDGWLYNSGMKVLQKVEEKKAPKSLQKLVYRMFSYEGDNSFNRNIRLLKDMMNKHHRRRLKGLPNIAKE